MATSTNNDANSTYFYCESSLSGEMPNDPTLPDTNQASECPPLPGFQSHFSGAMSGNPLPMLFSNPSESGYLAPQSPFPQSQAALGGLGPFQEFPSAFHHDSETLTGVSSFTASHPTFYQVATRTFAPGSGPGSSFQHTDAAAIITPREISRERGRQFGPAQQNAQLVQMPYVLAAPTFPHEQVPRTPRNQLPTQNTMAGDASENNNNGNDEETLTKRACYHLMEALVTHEAILGKDRTAVIKAALERASTSITGSRVKVSPKVRKNALRPLNYMYHAWKGHCTSPTLVLLGIRPEFNQPALSKEDVTRTATNLLKTFSYLRATPESEYFTANYFIQMVIHMVFECKPQMWVHINQIEPHPSLDNLFALGTAAIAANIRDYLEGTRNVQEVDPKFWRVDYLAARTLIKEIRRDPMRCAMLDIVQMWIMEQGLHIVSLSNDPA
ncbi:hypothetical protein JVT61DRAFT_9426 [Boletus reticuloceps]|uniref:Uncharacterized protein n=1 Tax=Boletus reticuloceps TaxID=495285 RepID=A0A8I3A548_9AGAM|nr:hypothetical protein JVT61DRAFT_9426 [Boletus reticuloceps]